MAVSRPSGLLAFQLAEPMEKIYLDGSYDPQSQLWTGTASPQASCTTTHSGTSCGTFTASHTNCGMDRDSDVDECGDFDNDSD